MAQGFKRKTIKLTQLAPNFRGEIFFFLFNVFTPHHHQAFSSLPFLLSRCRLVSFFLGPRTSQEAAEGKGGRGRQLHRPAEWRRRPRPGRRSTLSPGGPRASRAGPPSGRTSSGSARWSRPRSSTDSCPSVSSPSTRSPRRRSFSVQLMNLALIFRVWEGRVLVWQASCSWGFFVSWFGFWESSGLMGDRFSSWFALRMWVLWSSATRIFCFHGCLVFILMCIANVGFAGICHKNLLLWWVVGFKSWRPKKICFWG